MAFLADSVLDAAISNIISNGTRVDICSQAPTTYAEATSTYSLGSKTGLTLTGPANGDTSGRKCTIPTFSDGSVDTTGTATHYALTNGSNLLVAWGTLSASQAVTSGNPFTLPDTDITIPDAV